MEQPKGINVGRKNKYDFQNEDSQSLKKKNYFLIQSKQPIHLEII